jgi:tetratricopeptide (TPR) repeat protein
MRRDAAAAAAILTFVLSTGGSVADDPRLEVLEALRAGAEADARGLVTEARSRFSRAVAVAEDRLPGTILEANALDGLAFHLLSSDDVEAAIPLYERSLALYRALLAGDQPRVATSLLNLAVAESRAGRIDDARRHAGGALDIWSRLPPGRTVGMADALQLLANLARRAGDEDDAAVLDRRAREARAAHS